MYKLLIADDEALEREGLEMMLRRMMPEQFIFYHADNGRKAIQLAEEQRPDFIFMDIKMPGIQGLEAIREIKLRLSDCRIVLVTAHDFFSYAKEAISLGVTDYILKPAKREELLDVLHRMMNEKETEKRKRMEELEQRERLSRLMPLVESEITLMLMTDCIQDATLQELGELTKFRWDKGYAMLLSFPFQEKGWEAFQAVRKDLHESLREYAKAQISCLVSPMVGNKMMILVPAERQAAGFAQRVKAVQWGERLLEYANDKFGQELLPVIGIGPVQDGIEGLLRSYQAAVAAATNAAADIRIRHSEDMKQSCNAEGVVLEEERRLLGALGRHNRQEVRYHFAHLLEKVLPFADRDSTWCANELMGLFITLARQISLKLPPDFMMHISAAQEAGALRQFAEDQMERLLEEGIGGRENRQRHVIESAKAYIGEHYKTEISMEQTAEYVKLSPYYLSKLFKQHTGENFTDYVTRLRMEEAKSILGNDDLSLKEICFEVGYNDPNYFSRMFKKTTGMTPTEYRQILFEGKNTWE